MGKIRQRLYFIGVFIVLSIISLVPRNQKMRIRDATTGTMKDTTVRRGPVNPGLALPGGVHPAPEGRPTQGPAPRFADAVPPPARGVRPPPAAVRPPATVLEI